MSVTVLLPIGKTSAAQAAGVTRYLPGCSAGTAGALSGETGGQVTWRSAGTLANLYVRVSANATTGSSTLTSRRNTAAGAQTVSIGSGSTGEFQDTTHTDAIAAGDLVAFRMVSGAGGTLTYPVVTTTFAALTIVEKMGTSYDANLLSTASVTRFQALAGLVSAANTDATEINTQYKARCSGTLANLTLRISANSRTTTTTFQSRKNGANGNLTISVGSSATGFFEDTSNSDSFVAADLLGLSSTTGTGTGSLNLNVYAVDVKSTSANNYFWTAYQSGGDSPAAGTTTFYALAGAMLSTATETDVQAKAQLAGSASNLQIYVSANTASVGASLTFRKNAANGNQVVSIGTLATGFMEDTTNSDSYVATDELDYSLAILVGTGTLTFMLMGCMATGLSTATKTYTLTSSIRRRSLPVLLPSRPRP